MRHGETVWNTEGRKQGRQDSPLTARGVRQAASYGHILHRTIERPSSADIVSSPLGRAWQTAVLVAEGLGQPPSRIRTDARIAEISFGRWEGFTESEIVRRYPDDWQARRDDRWHVPAPGGESYADVSERVRSWLESVSEEGDLVVVSHGATSRVIRGLYAGLSVEGMLDLAEPQDVVFRLHDRDISELRA